MAPKENISQKHTSFNIYYRSANHSKEIKSVFHNSFTERKALGPENINRISSTYF